jgi:CRISPR-associated protein Cas2
VTIVVAYDVTDDDRRERIARALLDFGTRVQKSVFECSLTARDLRRMRARVNALLSPGDDRVRYYTLCGACVRRIDGVPAPAPPPRVRFV